MPRTDQPCREDELMLLTDYIELSCIVPELASKTKADVIKEITRLLFEKKKLKGLEPALDQIMAREITESTGIGHGLAVPHARVSGLKSLFCAVGRIKEGIDFSAVDKKPVQLIFLIAYPPTQQTTYLNFVATLAKVLRTPENFKAIVGASTAAEIHQAIAEASSKMATPEEYYAKKMKADPELLQARDAHADLILLARLQLSQEMHDAARSGKKQIKQRMENIRSLVDARIMRHYDRLMAARPPALVPVEGDTCQGCFMKLPSQFAQKVREDSDHIHTCPNCSRFIYIV
jgi:mannitol/fructose-specific phosphotransferase system IIA component (Ntr-type)